MATATLQRHGYPEGTSVSAWPAQNSVNGGPPAGVAVATATVTGGVLTFTGLTVGVRYIAFAAGRGVQFRADEALGADAAAVGSPDRERLEFVEAALTTSGATGPAGGVLSGTFPDPGFAVDMATQAELDAVELSKGRVFTGTAVPVLGDLRDNDTYFQVDGSGNVIAEYARVP